MQPLAVDLPCIWVYAKLTSDRRKEAHVKSKTPAYVRRYENFIQIADLVDGVASLRRARAKQTGLPSLLAGMGFRRYLDEGLHEVSDNNSKI